MTDLPPDIPPVAAVFDKYLLEIAQLRAENERLRAAHEAFVVERDQIYDHLRAENEQLQRNLNTRTSQLADTLAENEQLRAALEKAQQNRMLCERAMECEKDKAAAERFARELADLRVKHALTCYEVEKLQAALLLADPEGLFPPP